jgi:4'-phosphopantetheinyl transferase
MHEIAENYFTQNEYRQFISRNKLERLDLFYKLWSRKEAVLKALGKGLLLPLDIVDVYFSAGDTLPYRVNLLENRDKASIYVMDIDAPSNYAMAIASSKRFNPDSLVDIE